MHVVFLDYPASCLTDPGWEKLRSVVSLDRYRETQVLDLLPRCRSADVLVTTTIPLRREILDYVTRPRTIIVPAGSEARLVELPIAAQLGIRVFSAGDGWEYGCGWLGYILRALRELQELRGLREPNRSP